MIRDYPSAYSVLKSLVVEAVQGQAPGCGGCLFAKKSLSAAFSRSTTYLWTFYMRAMDHMCQKSSDSPDLSVWLCKVLVHRDLGPRTPTQTIDSSFLPFHSYSTLHSDLPSDGLRVRTHFDTAQQPASAVWLVASPQSPSFANMSKNVRTRYCSR